MLDADVAPVDVEHEPTHMAPEDKLPDVVGEIPVIFTLHSKHKT